MSHKIDTDIPPPPPRDKIGSLIAELQKLGLGHSFVYEGHRTSLYYAASRLGIKIRTQKEGNGTRVWRVA
jgi:hypothetical protein